MRGTLDQMDRRSFLLHEDVTNSMSMWPIVGMTAARLGVERKKNNITSMYVIVCAQSNMLPACSP